MFSSFCILSQPLVSHSHAVSTTYAAQKTGFISLDRPGSVVYDHCSICVSFVCLTSLMLSTIFVCVFVLISCLQDGSFCLFFCSLKGAVEWFSNFRTKTFHCLSALDIFLIIVDLHNCTTYVTATGARQSRNSLTLWHHCRFFTASWAQFWEFLRHFRFCPQFHSRAVTKSHVLLTRYELSKV